MKRLSLSLLLMIILLVASCNVQTIRKARLENAADKQQTAQVDSFLYYQPVVLNDPFLDSLNVKNDDEQSIKVRIVPPPAPPEPTTKQVDGFRVQTFAGLDSLNALILADELKSGQKDPVYFFKEKELYKIQVGDFLYRNDADTKVYDLRKMDISGAWVVQRPINVPIDTVATTLNDQTNKVYPYKLQILVTSDLQKAEDLVTRLKSQFSMESFYELNNKLYKIYLGKFATREDAQKVLTNVRENGYKDAWMIEN